MAYAGVPKVQKVMVQPINLIFRYLQNRTLVSVWLYENVNTRVEGRIIGFDEYMNLVLDDACECHVKNGTRKQVTNLICYVLTKSLWLLSFLTVLLFYLDKVSSILR